ncbi:hypothetical protein KIN20_010134 [Parelaphostrongylus tenuis]|uniref:F-box domain-containing protein n=1 Tax=Parelaphostrongylus tenuis TaxID=148309 RepID=A0AAD5MQ49_PARTN|nr:hypothetical protein KIN20_010134 [Parelaphostrongylus tenuis]
MRPYYHCNQMASSDVKEEEVDQGSARLSIQNPGWMKRIFRAVDGVRITSYFSVRKRKSEHNDEGKGDCKRPRRAATVSDVQFISQTKASNGKKPLLLRTVEFESGSEANRCSPSNRPLAVRFSTPLGVFGELPPSLIRSMFDLLEVSALTPLCMTSPAWTEYALDYIYSQSFLQRVQREGASFLEQQGLSSCKFFTPTDPFYCYGKFLKSVTVCLPFSKKFEVLMSFCERAFFYDGIDNLGVGRVLHTVCSDWALSRRDKVFEAILEWKSGQLKKALKKLSEHGPGSIPKT